MASEGRTALHFAAAGNCPAICRTLVGARAQLDMANVDGHTPRPGRNMFAEMMSSAHVKAEGYGQFGEGGNAERNSMIWGRTPAFSFVGIMRFDAVLRKVVCNSQ